MHGLRYSLVRLGPLRLLL